MQSASAIVTGTAAFTGTQPRLVCHVERDERIKAHLHVVRSVARAIRLSSLARGVESDDLFAYGAQGLVEAAARFDGAKRIPFAAFARHRIRGAIVDGIRTQHWLGRRAYRRFQSDPTTGNVQFVEIAESSEASGDARWNGRPMAQVPSAEDDSLQVLAAAQLRHLPERERRLIELCYYEGKTLNQAAAEMGFRRSWASRLNSRALATIRAGVEKQASEHRLRAGGRIDLRNQIDGSRVGSAR
jgi:RNA polymerase sigma factor for flagellar operon FliA